MNEKTDVKKLVSKWGTILKEGNEIKNKGIEKATAIMLENEVTYLHKGKDVSEATTWADGNVNYGGVDGQADFYKIAIPMVRRTFPELIAHEIVGVQPLTAPVGLAFALRYQADQEYAGVASGQELGHNTIDPYYSGQTTPTSGALSREDGEKLGSKSVSDVGGHPGIGGGLGIGTGQGIKEVSMTIEKDQVEAGTRKLRSKWSLEVAQDLKAMHGLDLEEEMMDVLSYEITAEIDRELINNIRAVANTNTSSQATGVGTGPISYTDDLDGRWEAEKCRNIYNILIRKANRIAIDTRRGAGNYVVSSPNLCAALETTSSFAIQPTNSDIATAVTGVARLGSLDGRMTVYRDTFATTDDVIIGYKGVSAYDTGIVYLPYIQLMISRAVFEDSFNPTVGLMSRYAIHNNLFGASNYYIRVEFEDLFEVAP
jgi:hypothetical protein